MKSSKFLTENLALWQLFVLITNFGLGSAIVVGIGNEAKQDAWIAVIFSAIFGVAVIWFFHKLCMCLPHKNLFYLFEFAYGRAAAVILSVLYMTYFLYCASRVLRDFGELMVTAVLPNTPLEIIDICFMFLSAYLVYLGIEVISRTSEIFSPYLFLFIVLLSLFLFIGSQFHLKNFQPVLAEGIRPVFKALIPTMLTFPFGEMIVFTVVMSQVTNIKYAGKISIIAVAAVGLTLTVSTAIQLGTLGVDQRIRSNFPLYSASREISVANFIERLDALVVFIMMLGILSKVCIYFYCGVKGLEYVFRLPYRYFVFPSAMLIALFSILIAENFSEHIKEGIKVVPYYLHLPLQFGLPLITFCILWWKTKKTARR